MQSLFRFISAFNAFCTLWTRATLAPSTSLNGWSLNDRDPRVIQQLLPLLAWLYHDYFHVQTSGWEHIPPTGRVLLIGSHNGGMAAPDLYMIMHDWYQRFGVERPAYALMNPTIWQILPGLARLGTQVGTLRAHPKMALAALHQDASLLIYPGGTQDLFRPYTERHTIHFQGHHQFVKLALETETPIIPLISHGAHETLIILTDLYPQLQQLHQLGIPWPFGIDPEVWPIYLGLPWGIAIGPWPNIPFPVQIHTRVCPSIVFDRYGHKAAQDLAYVNDCYQQVQTLMQIELDDLTQRVSRSSKSEQANCSRH